MILRSLSSQVGERSEQGNRRAAALILTCPALLEEIKFGLGQMDADLLGDCAEVCTMLAQQEPQLVAPLAGDLLPLLRHKNTRVRWEAMHALALVTPWAAELIEESLALLEALFRADKSTIVRDYAIIAAGNLAALGEAQAQAAFPLLNLALTLHETRFARHGLDGLAKSARFLTAYREDLMDIADLYRQHSKPSISLAARKLKKALQ
jgi:hypothetical protein